MAKLAMASPTNAAHFFFLVALFLLSSRAYGELSQGFYATNCSSLDQIIEREVKLALQPPAGDPRMGASLLRLLFHDCFVQGCDGSVLLDDDLANAILSEKNASPNVNSLRGFDVINHIKGEVEKACPGVVSCADILALAARQAVIALGGQGWPLSLGRRDSRTANMLQADTDLPSPNSDIDTLIAAFAKKKFTASELVALSGAHTIGLAQCSNVDQTQQQRCSNANANNNLLPLDLQTPKNFDNLYYGNLPAGRGLLHSDHVLLDRPELKNLVEQYAINQNIFFQDFANAMKKMSEMSVLTGDDGEIRRDCRKVN